jgi:hypothetical protein
MKKSVMLRETNKKYVLKAILISSNYSIIKLIENSLIQICFTISQII